MNILTLILVILLIYIILLYMLKNQLDYLIYVKEYLISNFNVYKSLSDEYLLLARKFILECEDCITLENEF
jgi:hypothetical protein